ncbi:hypothetical protein BD324DRAFT_653243 [Kockovaella imperatae]|uniref:Uncharacterized protein n=1 Tax=Kockovaella imperatae TaxID=4999 RepID=A0A1Y1UBK7_9TREE|nr:hypothetical protein BD324DRAFT_653243 [Kockovaella imperatae]ORX34465.1 hypothetical protein BD324DRAFT_653243 [Kockovaella imperatae]
MKFALLSAALGLLSATSASPIAAKRDAVQLGPCATTLCPGLGGLSLSISTPAISVNGDLTCVYTDLLNLLNGVKCVFDVNGVLLPGLSASQCLSAGSNGICQSCLTGYQLNAGQCVLNSLPPVTLTVVPTLTNYVTVPVTTIIPKITSTITGLNTVTVKATVTLSNPLPPATVTKTVTKTITSASGTVTNALTKTVTTGSPTKTQYELVFPTNCCPDAYLSLSAAVTGVSATANVKRDLSTVTVTALNTVTAVVTDKVGTLTGAAATVKVTVPAAKVTVGVTVTGKQKTVTKTSTVMATVTGGPKTVTATVTKSVPNTGVYTSTVTPPNVCPTAGLGISVGTGLGGVVSGLTPLQSAVQASLEAYAKLSAGLDVLVLCGSKLLAF